MGKHHVVIIIIAIVVIILGLYFAYTQGYLPEALVEKIPFLK